MNARTDVFTDVPVGAAPAAEVAKTTAVADTAVHAGQPTRPSDQPSSACKRLVVLISGRGSNFTALADVMAAQAWPAEIVVVISNKADASGLEHARERGIATASLSHKDFSDRAGFDAAMMALIDRYQPDLVILAGFMRILTDDFVNHYAGRLVNIHPSLLPAFPGLKTHEQALDAGVRFHGATVHFVTPTLDHGPVLIQGAVPVLPDDDAATLAARVLRIEHQIYPQAVRWLVQGQARLVQGRVQVDAGEQTWVFDGAC